MKCLYACILSLIVILYVLSGAVCAQIVTPPAWSVGDWWIVKSQMYDSGKIVAAAEPGWLPPQSWRFDVERQESIEGQPYFVVDIRPQEDNPCPYWFRYWFRISDRYVGRYEVHHPEKLSRERTREIGPSVVRKDFDPNKAAPFLTSKFPALPLTMPLFGVDERRSVTFAAEETTDVSETSAYTHPEFEISQEIQDLEARRLSDEAHPDFLKLVGPISSEGNALIIIQAKSSLKEVQNWSPLLPWCVYGQRIENSTVSSRYWLVGIKRY